MVRTGNPRPISEISSKELTIGFIVANLVLGSYTALFASIAFEQFCNAGLGPMFFFLLSLAACFGLGLARIWVKYIKEMRRRSRIPEPKP